MTETEKKALALVNEVEGGNWLPHETDRIRNFATICRAIEQHEAFKQEVSDAVGVILNCANVNKRYAACLALERFIIAKPDPLVEAWMDAFPGNHIDDAREECAKINAALAARGLEIREKQP